MPKLFISHSTADRKFVEDELICLFTTLGFDAWFAEEDIKTADDWERSILEGLKSSEWFVLVMSQDSARSEWVKDEFAWAIKERPNRVIPIIVGDCEPDDFHIRLARIQAVDFRRNHSDARQRLARLLVTAENTRLGKKTPTQQQSLILLGIAALKDWEVLDQIDRLAETDEIRNAGLVIEERGIILGDHDIFVLVSGPTYDSLAEFVITLGRRVRGVRKIETRHVYPNPNYFFRHSCASTAIPTHLICFSCRPDHFDSAMNLIRGFAENGTFAPFVIPYAGVACGATDLFFFVHVPDGHSYDEFIETQLRYHVHLLDDYFPYNFRTYVIRRANRHDRPLGRTPR